MIAVLAMAAMARDVIHWGRDGGGGVGVGCGAAVQHGYDAHGHGVAQQATQGQQQHQKARKYATHGLNDKPRAAKFPKFSAGGHVVM